MKPLRPPLSSVLPPVLNLHVCRQASRSGPPVPLTSDWILCTQVVFASWDDMAEPEQDKQVPPQRVGVREFRGNLSGFLRQARQGRSFVVMSHDQVLAEVAPAAASGNGPAGDREPCGAKYRTAPDFDTLPTDVLAAMEGEEE